MLLVTGLDLTIVGIFQYSAVAYYAVAAGLVTFFSGLQNAVFSALMPAAAVLHARGDSHSLGNMLISSSRYGTFLLVITGLPLMLFASPILRYWVGQGYAVQASKYLTLLVLANIIRLFMTPYAVTLIGTGQQRLVILAPVMEGVTNLIASVALGHLLGAIGVAYGTLCGAVVGVLLNMFYSMPRTTEIRFGMREYLRDALLKPISFTLPIVLCVAALQMLNVGLMTEGMISLAAVAFSATILWSYSLLSGERARLLGLLGIAPAQP
jgi:O-antigen/teichoic acid export membrane protein